MKIIVRMITSIISLGGLLGCTTVLTPQSAPESTHNSSITPTLSLPITPPYAVQTSTIFTAKPKVTDSPMATLGIAPEDAAQLMPLPPSQLTIKKKGNTVVLKWLGTGEDIPHYEVLRKITGDKDWQQLTNVEKVGDNSGWYEWIDTKIMANTAYIYGIRVLNFYGKISDISKSVTITLP